MKIITLRGTENTGKSHTINIAYSFLIRDGWAQVPGHFRKLGSPVFEDITDTLTKGGVMLGIVGMGDYQRGGNSLTYLIEEVINKGCTVVICACRNKPGIEKAITNYPDHHFVDKTFSTSEAEHRIVNVNDALQMINII